MDMKGLDNRIALKNGVSMPVLGYGTMPVAWDVEPGEDFVQTLDFVISKGYRNIDTAVVYNTEKAVGKAVRQSIQANIVSREDLFISTKLWNTDRGYDRTMKAFDASMERLGLDYLDLYLIHTPAVELWHKDWREINLSTWRAFEQLYKEGRIRAIGVSNFLPHHLQALMDEAEIVPMVNQVEVHPGRSFRMASCRPLLPVTGKALHKSACDGCCKKALYRCQSHAMRSVLWKIP